MKIEIKHRYTLSVLFATEAETVKKAIEEAVRKRADLGGADLGGADLRGAYLGGAYLGGADLRGADLGGADLRGADLGGAYLRGADLGGAKIRGDITVTKPPIQITGLFWPVTIWDAHMQIGCEFHSHAEWADFDNARIATMDGRTARKFWDEHKAVLLALCKSHRASTTEDV